MRELLQLLPSDAASLAIVDAVAKATILLGAAALTSLIFRRASAAVRHMIWALAIVSALLLPALSSALPRWQMPLVTIENATLPAVTASIAGPPEAPMPIDAPRVVRPPRQRTTAEAEAAPSPQSVVMTLPSWRTIALTLWAAGAFLILGRLALGIAAVFLMSRRTERVTDAPWLPVARELAGDLGISRRVTFLRSSRAVMPMAWGFFKPSVVMPAEADRWSAARLRVVLLHELAHVKRHDCLMHAVAQIACAVYWFNPLAWIAARRLRAERELACDDLVLAAGTRGSEYATELLEIARVMRAGRFPAALAGATLAMAHRSQLEGRLMAILDTTTPRSGAGRFRTSLAAAVFAAALMPLASLQTWAYAAEPTSEAPGTVSTQPPSATEPAPATDAQPVAPVTSRRDAVRGGVQGAVQGGVRGGIVGGVVAGVQSAVVSELALAQTPTPTPTPMPNPNPNPTPTPAPNPRWAAAEWTETRQRKPADPKVVAALTAALKDSDKEVRQTALHALVQMRDPSVYEPLVAALSDPSPDMREQAVHGLAQMRDRRAIPGITQALKDSSASVREQAAHALGQFRDPATVTDLMAVLRDQSASVREQAVFALGQIRDRRAVDALITAMKDQSASVREQAAFALGQIRDTAAVTALIAALKDESPSVRQQVAFALGQVRDARALDALTEMLKDANAEVRRQAAFAIGQIAR